MSVGGFKVPSSVPFTVPGFVKSPLYFNRATAMKKDSNSAVRGFAAKDAATKPVMSHAGGQHPPVENRYAALNKAPVKSAVVKGGRPTAHGHSRAR